MTILNVWLTYARFSCLRAFNLFKVASLFFKGTLATLNVLLATLNAVFDQLHHRQLPHPPSRAALLSCHVLPVHNHVEDLLSPPQSLLCYPGIVRLFDNLFGRQGAVGKDLAQELDGLTAGIGVFLVVWRGEKVLRRQLGLSEPGHPHGAALDLL